MSLFLSAKKKLEILIFIIKIQGRLKGLFYCTKPFSETDFNEDLKKITVNPYYSWR